MYIKLLFQHRRWNKLDQKEKGRENLSSANAKGNLKYFFIISIRQKERGKGGSSEKQEGMKMGKDW